MKEDTILNRILDVYDRSTKIIDNINENVGNISPVTKSEQPTYNYSHPEIDGNYLLFFNEIYTTPLRKWLKKILKKSAWSLLKRQVFFNATIRRILYDLIQKSHELSFSSIENNDAIGCLEQKIEQLSLSKANLEYIEQKLEQFDLSKINIDQLDNVKIRVEQLDRIEQELLERISVVETRVEQLDRIEQQLLERISVVADRIECLPQLEQAIEQVSFRVAADNSLKNKIISVEESKISSGLWFNEPIIIHYREDRAYWAGTNERIIEKNFILLSLARLYESSQIQILDVGSAESLLAYELASLNYNVTAIDIRPISLSHPNLKFIKSDICHPVLPTASFDCVIALSTLEHIGLGWYGDEVGAGLDRQAVEKIYSLIKPEGSFILTVPYGRRALTPVHRIYDRESLQNLVQDFRIVRAAYGIRLDDFTYHVTDNEAEASLKEHNPNNYLPGAVAMLVCKKI
jgi:2-polyprenyl-3-methyl-5-hydroxy-6-metoxy-1,4-benzoquinol methylase